MAGPTKEMVCTSFLTVRTGSPLATSPSAIRPEEELHEVRWLVGGDTRGVERCCAAHLPMAMSSQGTKENRADVLISRPRTREKKEGIQFR